jgi:hypothetical protein
VGFTSLILIGRTKGDGAKMKKPMYLFLPMIFSAVLGNCKKQATIEQEVPLQQTLVVENIAFDAMIPEGKKSEAEILFSLTAFMDI